MCNIGASLIDMMALRRVLKEHVDYPQLGVADGNTSCWLGGA